MINFKAKAIESIRTNGTTILLKLKNNTDHDVAVKLFEDNEQHKDIEITVQNSAIEYDDLCTLHKEKELVTSDNKEQYLVKAGTDLLVQFYVHTKT